MGGVIVGILIFIFINGTFFYFLSRVFKYKNIKVKNKKTTILKITESKGVNTEKNTFAVIGFSLGLLSIFFASIGLIPIAGIITSLVGIYKSGKLNGKGKIYAIIGLLLSIIYFLVHLKIYGYI